VLIYGPPKSGKTLLALYYASRAGRPLLLDLDLSPPLVAHGLPRIEGDQRRLLESLHRALKLASALRLSSMVVDSLTGPLELLGPSEVAGVLRNLRTPLTLAVTSPVYLSAGLEPVKASVDRASGELVAAGPGLMLRTPIQRLVSHLWEVLHHGSPRQVEEQVEEAEA
jgi:hypothetical protein